MNIPRQAGRMSDMIVLRGYANLRGIQPVGMFLYVGSPIVLHKMRESETTTVSSSL